VLHPSPLQTKTIAKRIFKTRSTVLFATDTFLQQYMRASADGGLSSLRIAIGKMLPGLELRLETVEGLEDAGRLFVRGPNIMKGYISSDNPGEVVPLPEGWHDTGDVVSINEDGYYVIKGRLKRFAKIGGEMVSLAVVENCASALWPDNMHAAAIVPDPKRGEQIILLTDYPDAKRADLLRWAQTHGVPEISVPKKVGDALPLSYARSLDLRRR